MKIIDLLNKIANGEEDDLLTEFEFDKRIWNFKGLNDSEFCLDGWLLNQNITITKHKEILEEEPYVEICGRWFTKSEYDEFVKDEEEKKIPENNFNYIYSCEDEHIMANFENIKTTLKDIIDYLKSKGE